MYTSNSPEHTTSLERFAFCFCVCMGKSFTLRCFAKSLNPNLYPMEYICLSTVSVMKFYRQLCSVLGVEPRGGKPGIGICVDHAKDKPQFLIGHIALDGHSPVYLV